MTTFLNLLRPAWKNLFLICEMSLLALGLREASQGPGSDSGRFAVILFAQGTIPGFALCLSLCFYLFEKVPVAF